MKSYALIFAILLAFTGLTTAAAFVDLGPMSTVVALAIAGFKAALVALFFMHLRTSSRLTWLFAGVGVFWLALLIALTLSDVLTRNWMIQRPIGT
jgi:cytochrome c oxidase subunit 4